MTTPNAPMDLTRKGHWLQTATGIAYWPADPRADEVSIADIAHHLSLICRFTGAVRRFYSVAEHSVLVSHFVPLGYALVALLHDATEAYLSDLSRPVKRGPNMDGYVEMEFANWQAIVEKFELPLDLPKCVHDADIAASFAEHGVLLTTPPRADWGMGCTTPITIPADRIRCLSPQRAKRAFLQRFHELTELA